MTGCKFNSNGIACTPQATVFNEVYELLKVKKVFECLSCAVGISEVTKSHPKGDDDVKFSID